MPPKYKTKQPEVFLRRCGQSNCWQILTEKGVVLGEQRTYGRGHAVAWAKAFMSTWPWIKLVIEEDDGDPID